MTTAFQSRKLAFTAKVWGHGAVVCRAEEGRPGPAIDQEFGYFESWTRANAFANKLNEGLDLNPAEVHQIISDSSLRTEDLLNAAVTATELCDKPAQIAGKPVRIQFLLAELDLATTFCRMLQNKPSPHAERMTRNARNAVFDAMHYVFRPECSNQDAEIIGTKLGRLLGLLERATTK